MQGIFKSIVGGVATAALLASAALIGGCGNNAANDAAAGSAQGGSSQSVPANAPPEATHASQRAREQQQYMNSQGNQGYAAAARAKAEGK